MFIKFVCCVALCLGANNRQVKSGGFTNRISNHFNPNGVDNLWAVLPTSSGEQQLVRWTGLHQAKILSCCNREPHLLLKQIIVYRNRLQVCQRYSATNAHSNNSYGWLQQLVSHPVLTLPWHNTARSLDSSRLDNPEYASFSRWWQYSALYITVSSSNVCGYVSAGQGGTCS